MSVMPATVYDTDWLRNQKVSHKRLLPLLLMFRVEDVPDVVERLRHHSGELVGEVAEDQKIDRLCTYAVLAASSSRSPRS
jgi:hypothetical protein